MSKLASSIILGIYLPLFLGSVLGVAWVLTRWLFRAKLTWADLRKAPSLLGLAFTFLLFGLAYETGLYGLVRWWPAVYGPWGLVLSAAMAGKVLMLLSIACVLAALSKVQTGVAHILHVALGLLAFWAVGAVLAYLH